MRKVDKIEFITRTSFAVYWNIVLSDCLARQKSRSQIKGGGKYLFANIYRPMVVSSVINLFDTRLSKSPLIWVFSYVVASCSTTINLNVDTPVLGNISEDGFTHWRSADVPCIIFAKLEIFY